ncbi:MAG: CxxxxCH/CxxCH domain-containing protein [Nitrospirae bacterium]|nr:CxxxxCH/CxxCH domain-containing protein [Nitrospirota bacterium]
MRRILFLIGIMIFSVFGVTQVFAVDAPHNTTNAVGCADCHNFGSLPLDDACLSCHINDTGGGYSKNNAPKVLTHSSENTSTKWGSWSFTCKTCHHNHTQEQRDTYTTQTYLVTGTIASVVTNGSVSTTYNISNKVVNNPDWTDFNLWGSKTSGGRGLIMFPNLASPTTLSAEVLSATASSITVTGYPGFVSNGASFALVYGQSMRSSVETPFSGVKTVKLLSSKGANSMAHDSSGNGTDATPDGICQVCHTRTTAWRVDGTLAGAGHNGVSNVACTTCHKHETGFKPDCTYCHARPPIDAGGLVTVPAATGSTTAGAHNKHVNTLAMTCDQCHYNSSGTGATHNDGTIQAITLGFRFFGGAVQGGKYDGQAAADYNATTTSPPTTVTKTGTLNCSNIYCHSIAQSASGGALTQNTADYKTPQWNGTVVCGDCHKSDGAQGNATLMDSGSHATHVGADNQITCGECHSGAGSGTANHPNNVINMGFGTDPFGKIPAYSQATNTPGNGYGTCSLVYCHSAGQSATGTALTTGLYKTPTWGATIACGGCHDASPTTGRHAPHLAIYSDCSICHDQAGHNTLKHADKNVDVKFNSVGGVAGTYSQSPNPAGNGYGTCSSTNCHGTKSAGWGTTLGSVDQCTKCHGTDTAAPAPDWAKAPPGDTEGNTLNTTRRVGAHQAHVRALDNLSSPIACNECHIVPQNVTDAGHNDTALPAEVTFGTLATTGGLSPAFWSSTSKCTNTYCHGGAMPAGSKEGWTKTPAWDESAYISSSAFGNCNRCHAYPPVSLPVHKQLNGTAVPATDCIRCHNHVNAAGTGFTDPSKHVNGVLDVSGDACLDCHPTAKMSTSHARHTDPATMLAGKSLSNNDYGDPSWWFAWSNVGGVPVAGCGLCHPASAASHNNRAVNLNFSPNEAGVPDGNIKKLNGIQEKFYQYTGVKVFCSSVYCHSNGYNYDGTGYTFVTSLNWYSPTASSYRCDRCHGNSPNDTMVGSPSHYNMSGLGVDGNRGGHSTGIHYKNTYTGVDGVQKDLNDMQNAHGDPLTSSTISCSTCHYETVTSSGNDHNSVCAECHNAGYNSLKGDPAIAAGSNTHINGAPDVVFAPIFVKTRAQLKWSTVAVPELNDNWTRNDGYKLAGSNDASVQQLNNWATFDSGSKTCSAVACHNGYPAKWGASNITCNSCHKSLP